LPAGNKHQICFPLARRINCLRDILWHQRYVCSAHRAHFQCCDRAGIAFTLGSTGVFGPAHFFAARILRKALGGEHATVNKISRRHNWRDCGTERREKIEICTRFLAEEKVVCVCVCVCAFQNTIRARSSSSRGIGRPGEDCLAHIRARCFAKNANGPGARSL
jgi:hypothetical protein